MTSTRLQLSDLAALTFTKMNGSGNDFAMIDNRTVALPHHLISCFTRQVCRRGLSLGADGVVLIENTTKRGVDFRWRYVNADGSDGEMCGNGAMCAARFAHQLGICGEKCCFETPAGLVRARLGRDGEVAIEMARASADQPIPLSIEGEHFEFLPVSVGVPHVVAFVDDVDTQFDHSRFDALGRTVRNHTALAPAGANVNMVSFLANGDLRMRTWERGVEAETLACGTGAVAAAIAANLLRKSELPITIQTSSGLPLTVMMKLAGRYGSDIWLSGTTRIVANGTIQAEAYL